MRAKLVHWILGLAILLVAGASTAHPPQSAVPEIVVERSDAALQSAPWWVAAEVATGPEGALNQDFFTAEARERVQALLHSGAEAEEADPWSRMRRPGCDAVSMTGESISTMHRPSGTIRELVEHAERIVHAEVTHWRQGFLDGVPASLYALRPIEIFKGPEASVLPSARLFLVYPFARIPVAGRTICGVGERFPAHPEPGSEILVFSYPHQSWTARGDLYLRPTDSELFFSDADGALSIPARHGELSELDELDLGFFLTKTREELEAIKSAEGGGP